MAKHFDKQFKLDAVQYYHDHKELGLQGCAKNLGISQQTLSRWQKELRDTGDIASRDPAITPRMTKRKSPGFSVSYATQQMHSMS